MKILLIGGAGFIGSRTALRLLSEGHEPLVLDCLDPQIHGENFASSFTFQSLAGKMEILHEDTRDPAAVNHALEHVDAVFFLAAATGTGQSMYQVERYCDVNVRGAGVFAEALGRHTGHIQRVIVSSTRAVYGEGAAICSAHGRVFPLGREARDLEAGQFETLCPRCGRIATPTASNEADPERPHSIYGITKLAQEQIISHTARNLGIPCVVFRYQNVYGPGQSLRNPYTGILAIFSQLAFAGREINLFEDGWSTRDFVHVDDVVEYNLRALNSPVERCASLNVGSGQRVTLINLVGALGRALGIDIRNFVSGQFRVGDIRHAAADCSALRKTFGTHDLISLPDGLRMFGEWMAGQQFGSGAPEQFDKSLDEMRAAGLFGTATAQDSGARTGNS